MPSLPAFDVQNGQGKQAVLTGTGDLFSGEVINNNNYYPQKSSDETGLDSFIDLLLDLGSFFDIEGYDEKLGKQRARDTGRWILRSEPFSQWLRSHDSKFLWMHGAFGCGKTFLASFVIDYLRREVTADRNRTEFIYLYFGNAFGKQPSFREIIATILLQLLKQRRQKGTSDMIKEAVIHCASVGRFDTANSETLKHLLLLLLKTLTQVFVVIDGIDNCEPEAHQSLIDTIKMLYKTLRLVKVLVTTRSGAFFPGSNELGVVPSVLPIGEKDITPDIQAFVEARAIVDNQDWVASEIAVKAGGIFLLAREHLDCLRDSQMRGDALHRAETLPLSAFESFNAVTRLIKDAEPGPDGGLGRHTFTYLLHFKDLLTIPHLQQSYTAAHTKKWSLAGGRSQISFPRSKEGFISACQGLIMVDHETGVVSAIHSIVPGCVRHGGLIPVNPHATIAKHCLIFLSSYNDAQGNSELEGLESVSFLSYAAKYWTEHLRSSIENKEPGREDTLELAIEFLKDTRKVTWWFQLTPTPASDAVEVGPNELSGLHVAILLDLPELAERLIAVGCDSSPVCSLGRTPLHLAAKGLKIQFVRLLLGADAKTDVTDQNGDTPLHLAVITKYSVELEPVRQEVLSTLLNRHSDRRVLNFMNNIGQRPFSWAVRHAPEAVTQLLARYQPPLHETEPWTTGWSPIREVMDAARASISSNDLKTTRNLITTLLEAGFDANAVMADGWTALSAAVRYGSRETVDLLLQKGAKADADILRMSIKHGQPSVAQLLLQHTGIILDEGGGEKPPLIYAARKKRNQHAWLLLEAGYSPNVQDSIGWTALHHALQQDNEPLAWLLMSKSASPNIQNEHKRTAIHFAVERRNLAMLHLLCMCIPWQHSEASGQDGETRQPTRPRLDLVDEQGMTPIHRAVLTNNLGVLQILLRCGGRECLDVRDHSGAAPLHHAVTLDWKMGSGHIAAELLTAGASLNVLDDRKTTPLMWAAERGDLEFVVFLLQRGAYKHARDAENHTAEDLATTGGHANVASCIKWWTHL